jgi:hypothetical protein
MTEQSPKPHASRTTSTGRTIAAADDAPARFTVSGMIDFQYDMSGVYLIRSKNGAAMAKRVLDWCPIVLERQDEMGTDRGTRTVMASRYVVQVGDVIHTATMDQLHDGSFWRQFPDADGTGSRSIKDVLENIVRAQGRAAPAMTELVDRSGWHVLRDGRRGYVYPNDTTYPASAGLRLAGRPTATVIEYCEPADPADLDQAPELFAKLAGELIEHAGPSLLGVPAGARAIVTSVRHARTSLLLDGPRGTGKTAAEWLAGSQVSGWGWPIVPTASFKDSPGAVETKLGTAGDMALTVDDCPNGANATNTEDSKANTYLELVVRSAETGGPIRDRQDRSDARQIRESNSIHGLPIISLEHLPRSMRGSLMRRSVIAKYGTESKADTRWLRANSDRVGRIMRAAGERVIRYVHATDWTELEQWLTERAEAHYAQISARVIAQRPTWDHSVDSILLGAAEIATGHDLLCAALEIECPELAGAIADHLVTAALHTADLASDEHTGSDDLSTALGDLIVKSLLAGRAHVANSAGQPGPWIPELSPGEQGVRMVKGGLYGSDEYQPTGPVPLYYLPDKFAVPVLAVRSASLHELAKLANDPRLSGFTASSLPGRLAEAGAVLEPTGDRGAKGARGTHQVKGLAGGRPRVVLVKLSILDGLAGAGPADAEQPAPTDLDGRNRAWVDDALTKIPTMPADRLDSPELTTDLDAAEAAGQISSELAGRLRAARTDRLRVLELASRPAPRASEPTPEPEPEPVPAAQPTQRVPTQRAQRQPAPTPERAATAPVCVIAGGFVITTAGEQRPAPADLPTLLRELAPGKRSEVLVIVTEPKTYGLAGAKPTPGKAWHKGFAPADQDGWHGEGAPTRRPHVGAWTNLEHPDHGIVRLCVLPWLGTADPFPLSRAELDAGDVPAPSELARRLELFHGLIGQTYRGTRASTAVRLLRDQLAATARGGARFQGTAEISGDMDALDWTWDTPDVAAIAGDATRVHGFDGNKNHLYPTREVRLCLSDLEHTGPIEYDPKRAGMFLIDVPVWPYPTLPAPTSQTGRAWVTAPILKRYARLGFEIKILESLSGPGVQPAGTRRFVEIVAHALTECERDAETAVGEAAKGLYQTLHGKLRSQSAITRHDWGLAIRDESWCSTLDKVYRIAGLEQVGEPIRGAVPVYVDMDEIVYATNQDTHTGTASRLGGVISIGGRLGQFKVKTDSSVSEWIQDRIKAKTPKGN